MSKGFSLLKCVTTYIAEESFNLGKNASNNWSKFANWDKSYDA